ncbi:MAG TPA: type IV pilus twitching motility protein PilT, partial [Deltaproteobacteria bacterium]|nr:type IV pilus twitching motility protein PilT [Deltaproteobacteria bacterium]
VLDPKSTRELLYSILTEAQKHKFEEEQELDLSFGIKSVARFRANIFLQRGALAGVFRMIPYEILPLETLGLPTVVMKLTSLPRGLILVTGPTGSGKSTTLAAFLDKINMERHDHIVTIEDPIEFVHKHKGCLVNQREIGSDSKSFANALKYILRQDPDVVFIGEMRDLETMQAALTVSETGHLVFATLHTNSAVQTVNRIVDAFPAHQQSQVRAQLAFVLEAVISQQLIPRLDGKGRVLASEVMISTPAIRNLIREDKIHQIYSQMQVGQTKHGMQTMNQALFNLYQRKLISLDDALGRSMDPEELRQMMASPSQQRQFTQMERR